MLVKLVNRFGRNVRRVLSIYVVQSSSLLKGARKGGHIRWHILKTETAVLSSDFRDGCLKTYSVSVTIDVSSVFFFNIVKPLLTVSHSNQY
jgi:hypothetical protein